jgi:hypothetical protein
VFIWRSVQNCKSDAFARVKLVNDSAFKRQNRATL